MTRCYVELNDIELTVTDEAGAELARQPACAAWVERKLVFGDAAGRVARTLPQQFNQRYLMALTNQPLPVALGPAKNHADLVYHQLNGLGMDAETVLGVPGYLSNEQLGYLLSICTEAGLKVLGFVDLGLSQSLATQLPAAYGVLDVELHRMVLSRYAQNGTTRSLESCQALDGLGVSHIIEGWLAVIADEFVQRTRFDPLHAGTTEQQVYDQVTGWRQDDTVSERRVRVGADDNVRELDVPQAMLDAKLAQRLESMDLDGVQDLAVTPRVQRVPGLVEFLKRRVGAVHVLPQDCLGAFQQLAGVMTPDAVQRLSEAEVSASDTAPQVARSPLPDTAAVTHLLAGHRAMPLNAFPGAIDAHTGAAIGTDVQINGRIAPGTVLRCGDEVHIGASRYVAIEVA